MNQHFFRKKIILDRISLGLVTFLIVILIQSRIAHSSDRPLPETTVNRVDPVLSVDLVQRSPQLPQKNLASIPDLAATNYIEKGRNLYATGRLAAAISAWQSAAQRFEGQGDRLNTALSFNYLSLAYQELGQLDRAADAIARSRQLLEEQGEILPEVLNTQGSLQLTMGQTEAALETWKQAELAYAESGDEAGRLGSLINQAGALQALGQYHRARIVLERIDTELDSQPDSPVKATALHSLGMALQVVGDFAKSQQVLEQSLAMTGQLAAQGQESGVETSGILLSLGNTAKALRENNRALDYYQQAAEAAPGAIAKVEAQLNQFQLLIEMKRWNNAGELIPQIELTIANLSPSRMSVYARANYAQSLMNLELRANRRQATVNSDALPSISQLLATAVREARELPDSRAESFALGQLGNLYEQTEQWAEARSLTEQALAIAQGISASDIIPRWQWQLGRILKQQGDITGAIASYREAVHALSSLRGDLTAIAPDVQFSFRESVEPIYRQLVGLLLQPDAQGQVSQTNLEQARETIELLQLAELDNFFRNACLQPQSEEIDRIDPTAATIYPIILPDRLAVILSLPGQPLRHYETQIAQREVDRALEDALKLMNPAFSSRQRLQVYQRIYDWLIRPAETDLKASGIQTLVFVMDGRLRNLPTSALYDGQQYLMEKYNIALTPGLQLLEPRAIAPERLSILTGGLTEARQGFSELPAVESEINQIALQVPSQVFLNREFTASNLQKQIQAVDFPIIHLATHAQFSSNTEETFILTWDGKIQVEDFRRLLLGRGRNLASPVELLVLSACQTAAGDDRAALGLAGIAVRSGARSTIATLWSVKDESTAQLMVEFYRQLSQSAQIGKAEALRQAQLALRQDSRYQHPFFWAPFVLIGNWL